jgi:hypothetical protein
VLVIPKKGEDLVYEQLKLCTKLWADDIKATYSIRLNQTYGDMLTMCKKYKIKAMVLIKDKLSNQGKVFPTIVKLI